MSDVDEVVLRASHFFGEEERKCVARVACCDLFGPLVLDRQPVIFCYGRSNK